MKHKSPLAAAALVLAVLLAMLTLSACGSGTDADADTTAPAGGIALVDQTGRDVILAAPATKTVALAASDAEILYALGAGGTVVGRGEYCDWPSEVLDVPAVSSGAETNIEQIIALEPELVFMNTMAQTPEQVEQLEAAGIAVYSSDAKTIEETYSSIRDFGTLTGKEAEAEGIIETMKATFDAATADKVDGGTIYFEVSPLEWGLWAAGSGTFMNEAAELVGLTNVFADLEGYAEVSEEQVIERNPDYILTITMYYGEGLQPVEELLQRPGWETVAAIQNQAIIELPNNELSRPGPRLAEGVQALSDFVHGR
ncbi:MAG: ABC transporter substrate-binding protein [Clostridiales Family XIII bacterium]|nr:ABC transporter substrate-binding protein [Clostridiales Family XIII bacterium]